MWGGRDIYTRVLNTQRLWNMKKGRGFLKQEGGCYSTELLFYEGGGTKKFKITHTGEGGGRNEREEEIKSIRGGGGGRN